MTRAVRPRLVGWRKKTCPGYGDPVNNVAEAAETGLRQLHQESDANCFWRLERTASVTRDAELVKMDDAACKSGAVFCSGHGMILESSYWVHGVCFSN